MKPQVLSLTPSVSAAWTLPQLLWLNENEPEIIENTKRVYFAKDYIVKLVGNTPLVMSVCNGTGMVRNPSIFGLRKSRNAEITIFDKILTAN